MQDSFDIQDKLFDLFCVDTVLCGLLGNPSDMPAYDSSFRRTAQDPTLLTSDMLPFFDFTFVDARETRNYLVNHGLLEFNIYASSRYTAMQIYKEIKKILRDNFDGFEVITEGQVGCAEQGVYCYRLRCKPLISS